MAEGQLLHLCVTLQEVGASTTNRSILRERSSWAGTYDNLWETVGKEGVS